MDLKQLCEINSCAGDEKKIRNLLVSCLNPICASVRIDRAGNVIVFKKGRTGQKHLIFSAHMDEVAFIVIGVEENGLLAFRSVGGIDPRVIVSKYVTIGENRVKGIIGAMAIHLQSPEDRKRVLDYKGLYIDIGARSKEEAEKLCPPGSYVYFDNGYQEFGDGMVVSKALDDRVGCWNMIRLLEDEYDNDITCVFASGEEVGSRGSICAGYALASKADAMIELEGTAAGDLGDVPETKRICECNKGAAISFMDKSSIHDRDLYRSLFDIASEEGIAVQPKRGSTGSNDAAAYQRGGTGVRTAVISVPCRYIHGPGSVAALSDIEAQYQLIRAFARQ